MFKRTGPIIPALLAAWGCSAVKTEGDPNDLRDSLITDSRKSSEASNLEQARSFQGSISQEVLMARLDQRCERFPIDGEHDARARRFTELPRLVRLERGLAKMSFNDPLDPNSALARFAAQHEALKAKQLDPDTKREIMFLLFETEDGLRIEELVPKSVGEVLDASEMLRLGEFEGADQRQQASRIIADYMVDVIDSEEQAYWRLQRNLPDPLDIAAWDRWEKQVHQTRDFERRATWNRIKEFFVGASMSSDDRYDQKAMNTYLDSFLDSVLSEITDIEIADFDFSDKRVVGVAHYHPIPESAPGPSVFDNQSQRDLGLPYLVSNVYPKKPDSSSEVLRIDLVALGRTQHIYCGKSDFSGVFLISECGLE